MGYSTVMNVPKIADYNAAYKIWNNVKPMRGRVEGGPTNTPTRPLGQRRDVDTYSIRKNIWTEAIECVLYQTPVVTFTADGEVKIKFGQWSSASTCQFITRILYGISAHRVRGSVVLTFRGDNKAMVSDHEELILVRGADGHWVPKEKQTLYDYRVNRKEANNVRKMCSTFRDYLRGVVKLKEEMVTQWGVEYGRVSMTFAELMEVFGTEERYNDNRLFLKTDEWLRLTDKPNRYTKPSPDKHEAAWRDYRETAAKFLDLIKDDQDDNCRHQNYWLAFNILFVHKNYMTPCAKDHTNERNFTLGSHIFEKTLDEALFMMFADKVFKRVELPHDKVPTGKYDKYFGVA